MDMFLQAGVLWNVTMGEAPMPEFDVKIVTSDGGPVMALNQVPIIPACAMHDIKDADVIILPRRASILMRGTRIIPTELNGSRLGMKRVRILQVFVPARSR